MLLFLVVAFPVLATVFIFCWPVQDYDYIGYGWKLRWNDGVVYVASRHLDTPAGRAGVSIGSIMLVYDGHPMQFATKEEFLEAIESFGQPKVIGHESAFLLSYQGKEYSVTLASEVIRGPIRVNNIPSEAKLDAMMRDPNISVGMVVCERTGQIVPTARLSDDAVDAVLRN